MISIKDVESMLEELADEFPSDFYKDLNGGIILMPEVKKNTVHDTDDLYILGEYHRSGNLGRFITIYYGSFIHVYKHLSNKEFKKQLKATLKHEFRHHLESLAGERDLEIEDARYIAEHMRWLGME